MVLRLAIVVGVIVLMLTLFQRSLIYVPTKTRPLPAAQFGLARGGAFDVQTDSDGVTLHGWHCLPHGAVAADSAECDRLLRDASHVVLFFSGNAGHRGYRLDELELLRRLGCHVFLFDYRGYAENEGRPSESAFVGDALQIWRYVTEERRVSPDKVIVVGESLGGGVAVQLAAQLCARGSPPGGLVLRSTFSSLVDVGRYHFPWLPVRWALIDRFLSHEHIRQVTCPVLLFHGTSDTIVPERFGRKLFAAAPERSATGVEKQFVELPGVGHNNVLDEAGNVVAQQLSKWFDRIRGRGERVRG